jgi:hypothetical protein
MIKQHQKNNINRGEASIVFTFVVLIIVLMGAFTISVISISTIKGAKSGENSALALYAADTGMERGMFEYWWSKDDLSGCNSYDDVPTIGLATYSMTVDDSGQGGGGCPHVIDITSGADSTSQLCIEGIGKSGGTERKLTSATGKDGGAACNFK